uniref:Putative capsid protein n=1 Tax=viral metagenome TaxID=1070528 RepID=A0A6H1ZE65_9ZZZZ
MTIGVSRVADLNAYFNNIFEDAEFIVREQNMMTRLVRSFTDGRGDQIRKLTEYPEISMSAVAETEDFAAPTQFDKSLISTLTPSELMAQTIITDRRIETDPQNARADAALEMGAAGASKYDVDLCSNFSSLTGGTVGAAGSTMIWGYFFAAISRLRNAKIPRPWYAVLHPYHWHALAKTAAVSQTVTNAPEFQDQIMRQWWVGNVAGVDVFTNANIAVNATTNDAVSAIYNPNAIAIDIRRDLRLEPERDASKRAWELNLTTLYAHGVWRKAWGVYITADATAPTS